MDPILWAKIMRHNLLVDKVNKRYQQEFIKPLLRLIIEKYEEAHPPAKEPHGRDQL